MGKRTAAISFALVILLLAIDAADARKVGDKALHKHHAAKQHDAAHASRKYELHKDAISGRTGVTVANIPTPAPAGRKLRQTVPSSTAIMPGMDVCLPAADAATFMVGSHATQMTVSNAAYKAGGCDLGSCAKDPYSGLYSCSTGLQWGIVQTWPQDHAMAAMFGNSGAQQSEIVQFGRGREGTLYTATIGPRGWTGDIGQVTEVQRVIKDLDDFTAANILAGDPGLT